MQIQFTTNCRMISGAVAKSKNGAEGEIRTPEAERQWFSRPPPYRTRLPRPVWGYQFHIFIITLSAFHRIPSQTRGGRLPASFAEIVRDRVQGSAVRARLLFRNIPRFGLILQNVAGLTFEGFAYCVQSSETNSTDLSGLDVGKIYIRYTDLCCQVIQRCLTVSHDLVQSQYDHDITTSGQTPSVILFRIGISATGSRISPLR